jgi:hypothetical protein
VSYQTIFREAVGQIPPTSVDVDRVIARQRRRLRLRRIGVVAAAAVTVGAVTVGATAVVGRPRAVLPAKPSPVDPPVPTPSPGLGESFTPTDRAIFQALARVAPDVEWAPSGGASEGAEQPVWHSGATTRGYTPDGYMGQGRIRSGEHAGHLSVSIPEDFGPLRPCAAVAAWAGRCGVTTGPAGEKITAGWARNPARGLDRSPSDFVVTRSVHVERPDGVSIIVAILGEDEHPPLTTAQMTALALDPAVAEVAADPLRFDDDARRMRIDSAVLASLLRHVPGVTGAERVAGAAATPNDLGAGWSSRGGRNTPDSYRGQGRILVDGVSGLFSVRIERRHPGGAADLTCGGPATAGSVCEVGTGPHGERYRTTSRSGAGAEREVQVRRTDGTWLALTLAAEAEGELPLTAAQQQAIAFDPAVALTSR